MHFRFSQGPCKNNQKANAVSLIVPLSQKLSIFLIGYQLTVKISCFIALFCACSKQKEVGL